MATASSVPHRVWTIFMYLPLLSALSAALQTPKITNGQYNITVDVPFTITWEDVVGPGVTIDLLELTGDKSIMFKESITKGVHRDDHHVWNPPPWLSSVETYLLGIIDESTNEVGYSPTFMVVGGTVPDLKVRGTNITGRQADNETNTVIPPQLTKSITEPPLPSPSTPPSATVFGPPIDTVSTTASTIPSQSSNSAGSSGGSENNNGGLSTGAKAGIGVGAALGALVLIAGLVYFIRSRRAVSPGGRTAGGMYESTGHANEPNNVQMFPAELSAGGREDVPRLQRVELQG